MIEDFERCYSAVRARDARFDGWFVTAVTSTRVYCRPSCPARTPKAENVRFFATAAAAQQAGFRACKRCRPDASPGSPEWLGRQDLVARAMRLIGEGVVDRDGVGGLAQRLGYSPRQLARLLHSELGAGPLALARAQRAQTARVLIETTALDFASVAFGAGFDSVRQFNDTVRAVFAATPTELRRRSRHPAVARSDALDLRLAYRRPYDPLPGFAFLADRAITGVEAGDATGYTRTVALPHGGAVVQLTPTDGYVHARLRLEDLRDLTNAVQRCRRLLDLDADPVAVATHLVGDPLLGPLVHAAPGRRLPGSVDPHELAVRAIVGQQVSVPGARALLGRLVADHGRRADPRWAGAPERAGNAPLSHFFPDVGTLAALDPGTLPLPRARAVSLVTLSAALADGSLVLDAGADAEEARLQLRSYRGIGPWTADYIALRAFGHPDVILAGDLGVRRALGAVGRPATAAEVEELARRWRPWRSYALAYLWSTTPARTPIERTRRATNTVRRHFGPGRAPARPSRRHARAQAADHGDTPTRKAAQL